MSLSVQTSMTDSEYNLDPNCLSRCSTELFSEASWEQVDKQDTEVSMTTPSVTMETVRNTSADRSGERLCVLAAGHSLVP